MKKNKLPENRLDIITPILSAELRLKRHVDEYPEMSEAMNRTRGERQKTTLYPITPKTPLPAREATEIIGYYFKREFWYDFAPYNAREHQNSRDRIFIITQQEGNTLDVVGAIVFRWMEYTDAPEQLILSWVWIHPFLRRQGILSAHWDMLRRLYGNFEVDTPLSKAMETFLTREQERSQE